MAVDPQRQFNDYQDPRWQRLRLRVFERDGWLCQYCQIPDRPLSVHHMYYVNGRRCYEYPLASLITLCRPCNKIAPWMVIPAGAFDEPDAGTIWESEVAIMDEIFEV